MALPLHTRPRAPEPMRHKESRQNEVAHSDPVATDALLAVAGSSGQTPSPSFDGADISASGLGGRVQGAAWWDAEFGGVRLRGANLAGASLRRANLSGADLAACDLTGASCGGITLYRARLEEASLAGADLIGGILTEIDAGEANFSDTLLEDASLRGARLRFANFSGAVMDGADFSDADLWGANLAATAAERTSFRRARLDETQLREADFTAADLTGASLRRADLSGARLRHANLRDAVLEGCDLVDADLTGAILPHVALTGCDLRHARCAGAWLERTRMRAHQLGGAIGEEVAGEFEAAREGYIVLEQNFRTLGLGDDASWAFRRRRRMGKRLHAQHAATALHGRDFMAAIRPALRWLGDIAAEWVCDYGESIARVLRALLVVLFCFAGIYWLTGCLEPREGVAAGGRSATIDYLLFSLDSMTTVGTSEVGLRPNGQFGVVLSGMQTVLGVVLLGLLGFVLGARTRN